MSANDMSSVVPTVTAVSAAATYYDRQYNARASVQDAAALIGRYTAESQHGLALPGSFRNVDYGSGPGDVLDIYPAAPAEGLAPGPEAGAPVFLYLHGGYWRALGKSDSAFMAPALTAAGAVVVVPDYDLAPAVSLDHIVDQVRRAFAWVWAHIAEYGGDPRRICICGSSAGGHLVGMLLAKGWQASYGLRDDAVPASALALSGIFDLQPLLNTSINRWLHLDDDAAVRLSPRFALPDTRTHAQCQLRVGCGEFESSEFKRQSIEYLAGWRARCLPGQWLTAPSTNHFDLPLKLADVHSPVYRTALQLMGL